MIVISIVHSLNFVCSVHCCLKKNMYNKIDFFLKSIFFLLIVNMPPVLTCVYITCSVFNLDTSGGFVGTEE